MRLIDSIYKLLAFYYGQFMSSSPLPLTLGSTSSSQSGNSAHVTVFYHWRLTCRADRARDVIGMIDGVRLDLWTESEAIHHPHLRIPFQVQVQSGNHG